MPVDTDQLCRLCWRHAASADVTGRHLNAEVANAGGQQLFLANFPFPAQRSCLATPMPTPALSGTSRNSFRLLEHEQLVLFPALGRDLRRAHQRATLPVPADAWLAAVLDGAVIRHATRHGWPASTTKRTRVATRILLGLQDTPGTTLKASDAVLLLQLELPALNVIEVAGAAGLLIDDRQPAVRPWFAANISELPPTMKTELCAWFAVMIDGASTAPRRRPRTHGTIRLHLQWALPALRIWAQNGNRSLREITPEHVRGVLPSSGNPRSTMGQGLRSIFAVLKGRKILFTNPIAAIRTGTHERRQPMPLDMDVIRVALNSPNPACAALTSLTAFHALRAGDLRHARITDISDGHLQLPDRSIPLAEPVRSRLTAWLTHRHQRWPNTANTHLFLNHWNATRTESVGTRWLGLTLGMPARVLREDRILHEIHATGGDVRRICDLFGLTVAAAVRYLPPLPDRQFDPTDGSSR